MKQIGFKNFRKFETFPLMDLSPLTIFVGENNAGKSTVVKAILSTLEFLSSQYFQLEKEENDRAVLEHQFFFNKSYFAHIGTFARALYNRAKNDVITFTVTESNIKFEIEIIGDRNDEEAISGKIQKISMNLLKWNIDLTFDFIKDDIQAIFHQFPNPLYRETDDDDIIRIGRKTSKKKLENYFKSVPSNAEIHTSITGRTGMIGGPLIGWLLERFLSRIDATLSKRNQEKSGEENTKFKDVSLEMMTFFKKNIDILNRYGLIGLPYSFYSNNAVEYIYAHAVTQTVIYSAKDTNDYFVKTIHEFANCRIQKGSKIHKFITKWMRAFGIGYDYTINSVGGEAHVVKILDKDNYPVNLADKGMGSIQLMVLLFRLATKMADRAKPTTRTGSTIIVEEPEQNLHPKLQSKLADLFFELNKTYGFNFIIETHSEYLIRKTQVIVSECYNDDEKIKKNPFKVYYFPSDSNPYEVKYRTNGRFENDFGQGFFDEAANLTFKLF
jgi:predicted ATPase